LVDKLLKKQERRKQVDGDQGVLGDTRFSKLFEDEEFQVDETSREFQALNPSTKVDTTAVSKAIHSDSETDDSEDEIISKPKPKPEMRISSSSYRKSGHQRHEKALGSRISSAGRVSKNRGDVVGERQITFSPSSGKKEAKEKSTAVKKGRRDDGRRSASGNVFRKL